MSEEGGAFHHRASVDFDELLDGFDAGHFGIVDGDDEVVADKHAHVRGLDDFGLGGIVDATCVYEDVIAEVLDACGADNGVYGTVDDERVELELVE